MQILLKSAEHQTEVTCSVCGQGFAIFWEPQSRAQMREAFELIDTALASHHHCTGELNEEPSAHPLAGFLVPDWDGPIAYSGAALLGNAPPWAL